MVRDPWLELYLGGDSGCDSNSDSNIGSLAFTFRAISKVEATGANDGVTMETCKKNVRRIVLDLDYIPAEMQRLASISF